MLVGQQLGPFKIDKELGAGAMGAVFRGRYVKTGQVVAVKVMAPGLGDSNPNAVARFEREARILKQLNHPNIVRLFGVGKYQGTRYYAMEYVVGESLDRVMSRRGRMTWEEVVTLGQQLCAALQHAHDAGVVHRDLKPSNLMILSDGTLKLTDFGIAKDLDVTALTSANCTVGTASYMSPEQCRGEKDIGPKSDLYSMGVLFYELITGRKPFEADNAMEMFVQHCTGAFERPSRLVLDMPVWLDNLICQLLEKKPEQRPLNADMIYRSLGSIQEKVEAQQSAGVEAARARLIDGRHGTRNPDEEDKEAARTLRTGKAKVKRKRKTTPFYRQVWFQAIGIVGLLALMGGVVYLVTRPASPETLYAQAKKLMESSDLDKHEDAYNGPISAYRSIYASREGDQTAQILSWKKQVEFEQSEERLNKLLHSKFKLEPANDSEHDAVAAAKAEEEGDLEEAKRLWQKMVQKYDANSGHEEWGYVARKHLAVVTAVPEEEKKLLALLLDPRGSFRSKGVDPPLEGPEKKAYTGLRYEHLGDLYGGRGDLPMALHVFKEMKDNSGKDTEGQSWEAFAAWKCKTLEASLPAKEEPHARKTLVQEAVDAARMRVESAPFDARAIALTVAALYGDDAELKAQVEQARQIVDDLKKPPH
jgi:tetratricopeptide (TPR) repeat protein/predicted Ser/Thr protein kinase